MSIYTLASMLVEFDGDTSKLDRKMDGAVQSAQRGGSRAGSAFALSFANPVLNAIGGINNVLSGAQTGINFAVSVTGMSSAAQLGDYRRMLTGIAKDANVAEAAFKSFQKIASDSNFDTGQVFQFGIRSAGRTGDVSAAATEAQTVVDAAQVFGVTNPKFDDFQYNLGDIRNRGDSKVMERDYRQFVTAAPLATTKIADALGITTAEAVRKIHEATGNELMQMINSVGAANKGAAAKAGAADPFKVAANIKDDAANGMAPTGDLLNKAITPVLLTVRRLAGGFGDLNNATGGGAGLIGILALGTAGVLRFGGTAKTAWNITTGLTGALRDLATAEESATLATRSAASAARSKASAEEQEAMAMRSRQLSFPLFGMPGLPVPTGGPMSNVSQYVDANGKIRNTVTIGDRLRGIGKSPLAPLGVAFGLELLGNGMRGNEKTPLWQRETGTALQDIGMGVGMGAPFGFVGMGIGALLGAVGAGIHVYSDLKAEREKKNDPTAAADALKDSAKNLKDAAGNLEKFGGRANGLGARGRAAVNSIEADYALAQLMAH